MSLYIGQGCVALLVVVVGFLLNRKWGKSEEKLGTISLNVDGRLGEALTKVEEQGNRIEQLAEALRDAGVGVPLTTKKTSLSAPSASQPGAPTQLPQHEVSN